MRFNSEDLRKLKEPLLAACRDYEPWADMMYWSGTGDHGIYDFPLDIDKIERIDISVERIEAHEESIPS
jgi:hypothetical protein